MNPLSNTPSYAAKTAPQGHNPVGAFDDENPFTDPTGNWGLLQSIYALNNSVDVLEASLSALEGQLAPVLGPPFDEGVARYPETAAPNQCSKARALVDGVNGRVNALANRSNALLSRLDLGD